MWGPWRVDDNTTKYTCCLDAICIQQDAHYRLVLKLSQPKIRLLVEACRVLEGEAFDLAAVRRIASNLRATEDACKKCVDRVFTAPWVHRLLECGDVVAREAHVNLRDLMAVLRASSTKVEKTHLIGQELKPKKRGAGIQCDTLSSMTFHSQIVRSAEVFRHEAQSEALGHNDEVIRAFAKCLRDSCASAAEDRRTTAARADGDGCNGQARKRASVFTFDDRVKRRRLRGYDLFVKANYADSLPGATTFDKRKVVNTMWKTASDEQKAAYNTAAEGLEEEDAKNEGETFLQFHQRHKAHSLTRQDNRRESRYKSDRLRAIQQSLGDMVNSGIFSCGAQLHHFGAGVKPELIPIHESIQAVSAERKRLFRYDHEAVPNPKGKMTFFTPCCLKYGGFCEKEDLIQYAATLTYTVYAIARAWKLEFPVFVEFETIGGGNKSWAFLGRLVGKGELGLMSKAIRKPIEGSVAFDVAELDMVELDAGDGHATAYPLTSMKFFIDFLVESAVAHNVDPKTFAALDMTRWEFKQDHRVDRFRVLLVSALGKERLSCITSSKPAAKLNSDLPFGLGSRAGASWTPAAKKSSGSGSASGSEHSSSREVSDDVYDSEPSDGDDDGCDDSADDAAPLVPEPEDVPEPWNAQGITCYEIAPPGARAACCICNVKIVAGEFRLDYRYRVSNDLRDQKRFHPRCTAGIPAATRARDSRVVATWIAAETDPLAAAMLLDVAGCLIVV